ncbi:cholinesterase [Octopus bimaculoides]|uniref:cholinesterase n=1 Tax=Octopus bimaculoides TaxID=37653 RepID=UPI00071C56B4|nr:cholinesterase [Octopus bimaculoides]
MHVISPMSRNLFRNAIIMSGTLNTDLAIKSKMENIDRAKEMAAFLRCPTENDEQMLNCFLNADAKNLTKGQIHNSKKFIEINFAPIVDNYFLQKPNEILRKETIKKDVLIGFVKNEGSLFLLDFPKYFTFNGSVPINYSIAHKLMKKIIEPVQVNPAQLDSIFYVYGSHAHFSSEAEKYRYVLDQVAGDTIIKCPAINFSREWSTHSNVYMYSFEYRSNFTPWPEWMGVLHASDIFYVFSYALSGKNFSLDDNEVSEMMSSYFANFSKSG